MTSGRSFRGVRAHLGLTPFTLASEVFTAIGDRRGLLILVRNNRAWFPRNNAHAQSRPPIVVITGTPQNGVYTSAAGWQVRQEAPGTFPGGSNATLD
jgi:hypothetical protein